jgi:MFS family permease
MIKTKNKSLWKQRNFLLMWSGQLVSWTGTEVSSITMPLVVLALTGSPARAGTVAAIRGLVFAIWSIPAGVLIDRWDRKTIMFIANLGSGLAMGSIALALYYDRLTLIELYIACAVEGSFFVFANISRIVSFPKVVSKEQFVGASTLMGTASSTGVLAGPPLGGFLYQTIGGFASFLADSLSYIVNAFSIFFINVPLSVETSAERKAFHKEFKEAFSWYWHQPVLRFLSTMTAGRTMIVSGLYLTIVVLAKDHHANAAFIGLIFAFAAGGEIVGSLIYARIHKRFRIKQLLILVSALSLIVISLYAFVVNSLMILAITALVYAVDPFYVATASNYTTKIIPDAIRGRVMSLVRLVTLGAYSFGFFVTGITLQYLGSRWTIGIFSCLLFVLLVRVVSNSRLAEVDQVMAK